VREVLTDKQCVKLLSAFTEKKRTLVKAVVERGVLKCEADAYKQIMTGKVLVNGHVCADPQREVSDEDEVWVSETANRGKGSR
jgi:predicted rRNA methylase YqxC with S4 and FtsJ domains